MIVLTGGRMSGKTAAMIRWLAEDPQHRGIVCVDAVRARHILSELYDAYPDMRWNWKENLIMVDDAERFLRGRGYGRAGMVGRHQQIGIDDAEEVLSRLFGGRVEIAALNATWIPLGPSDPIKAEVARGNELPWSDPEHGVMGDIVEFKKRVEEADEIFGGTVGD